MCGWVGWGGFHIHKFHNLKMLVCMTQGRPRRNYSPQPWASPRHRQNPSQHAWRVPPAPATQRMKTWTLLQHATLSYLYITQPICNLKRWGWWDGLANKGACTQAEDLPDPQGSHSDKLFFDLHACTVTFVFIERQTDTHTQMEAGHSGARHGHICVISRQAWRRLVSKNNF